MTFRSVVTAIAAAVIMLTSNAHASILDDCIIKYENDVAKSVPQMSRPKIHNIVPKHRHINKTIVKIEELKPRPRIKVVCKPGEEDIPLIEKPEIKVPLVPPIVHPWELGNFWDQTPIPFNSYPPLPDIQPPENVPEPGTIFLMFLGLASMMFFVKRK
jgi:hypothetical protein